MVSYAHFQSLEFCYESFYDLEKEEFIKNPLYLDNPSFDGEHDNHEIENIDVILHIKTLKWDIECFCFEGGLIYDFYNVDSRANHAVFGSLGQHNTIKKLSHDA